MALTITDDRITSDEVDARAERWDRSYWTVTTRPLDLYDRNQAITAMTIEEELARPTPDRSLIESLENELR